MALGLEAVVVLVLSLQESAPPRMDHSAFDAILREHVRDERVDYLLLRKNAWKELVTYLDSFAILDPRTFPRNEGLAALLNLYNATMIRTVIERLTTQYSPSENGFGVFKESLVRVDSTKISLNQLENEWIRPLFREPRIHVALVCAATSCPALLQRAYAAADLEKTLEENMLRFVNDASRNPIDVQGKRLQLSKIFEWYAADFGGREQLPKYVDPYHPADVAAFTLSFVDFAWKLNIAAPRSGEWVAVKEEGMHFFPQENARAPLATVKQGEIFEVLERSGDWLRVDPPFSELSGWMEAKSVEKLSMEQH